MTTTTISPFIVGELKEVELTDEKGQKRKLFRKQILPSGTRKYKGGDLDFTKINPAIVKAFDEKAIDAVPFVFAEEDNKHPTKGGEIKKLEGDLEKVELATDGLYGYFSLSDEAKRVVANSNGKFGVSAAIDVDYEREDIGKKWDYVLSHVCGTTGPHIKGMAGWEVVELSDDEKKLITIDLSTEVIDEVTTTKETGDDLVAVEIPKAELDELLAFMKEVKAAEAELTKKGEDSSGGQGGSGGEGGVKLSEADNKRIQLAEEKAQEGYRLAESAQSELAKTRWEARKIELSRAGVPPILLAKAERVLRNRVRPTIQLTEGTVTSTVDVAGVIEEILDECKGFVNLSERQTSGVSDPEEKKIEEEFNAFEKDFFENFNF